ncbi:hypothetical protein CDL15_Pgr027295 [Punica granatum]|uniref:Uncharacterized protein n=1 Tax=Punica granatum TaxID=22663 RepID=A0A218XT30_PUNGR|nr:hypothetical protein CDL15_Pgr027295 [Punica granatum]
MTQLSIAGDTNTVMPPIKEWISPVFCRRRRLSTGATRAVSFKLFVAFIQMHSHKWAPDMNKSVNGALGQSRRRPISSVGPVRLTCPHGTRLLEPSVGRLRKPTRNQGKYAYVTSVTV